MRTFLLVSGLILALGCGVSSEPAPEAESTVESALVCPPGVGYICIAEDNNECQGFGLAPSLGRCRADAMANCIANCDDGCHIVSEACDF